MFQMIPFWTPFLPTDCNKPPTIYSLLESIVNYDAETRTTTSNLAKEGRTTIFDFTYPLSSHVSNEDFECMILNHFMMRRIGYETLTAFKIALNVKLNEIMPNYNLLFDALYNWSLFDNGETITRNVSDSRTKHDTISGNDTRAVMESGTNSQTTSDSTTLSGTTSDSTTSDRRFSNMPNNQIASVQDGSYLSDYNYDHNTGSGTSSSTGTSSGSQSGSDTKTLNEQKTNAENKTLTDAGQLVETITKTNDDTKQMDILIKFIQNKQNIYTMIFKDLDVLFYQLD